MLNYKDKIDVGKFDSGTKTCDLTVALSIL